MFVHPYWICLLALTGTIDAEFWSSWRLRQKNRRICKNFELCMIQSTGKLNKNMHVFLNIVRYHWVVNESFSKLNNSNMERRIRLARLRNLNNIYLVPQEDTILFYINVRLQKYGIEKAIVINAEDTYVSVRPAYVAHHVEENLHRKRKRVIYDWKKKRIMLYRTCWCHRLFPYSHRDRCNVRILW